MTDDRLQYLFDRAQISDTITRYFVALDRFDWDALRGVLADEFALDAGGLVGTPSKPVPLEEFIETVTARNAGFTATVHLHPNHLIEIDGDTAHAVLYMYASHAVEEEWFTSMGMYDMDLVRVGDGWRLTRINIQPMHSEGGDIPHIYELSAERFAKGQGNV